MDQGEIYEASLLQESEALDDGLNGLMVGLETIKAKANVFSVVMIHVVDPK